MGSWNVGPELIQAFEAGRQAKMQREKFAQDTEDRKLYQQHLKLQMDGMKMEQALHERQNAFQEQQNVLALLGQQKGGTLPGTNGPATVPSNLSVGGGPAAAPPDAQQGIRDILMGQSAPQAQGTPIPGQIAASPMPATADNSNFPINYAGQTFQIPVVSPQEQTAKAFQDLLTKAKIEQQAKASAVTPKFSQGTMGVVQTEGQGAGRIVASPRPPSPHVELQPTEDGYAAISLPQQGGTPTVTPVPQPEGTQFQKFSDYQRQILGYRKAALELDAMKLRQQGQFKPDQAMSALKLVQEEAKAEQQGFNEAFRGKPIGEIEQAIATRRGFDLGQLNKIASGGGQQPPIGDVKINGGYEYKFDGKQYVRGKRVQ